MELALPAMHVWMGLYYLLHRLFEILLGLQHGRLGLLDCFDSSTNLARAWSIFCPKG